MGSHHWGGCSGRLWTRSEEGEAEHLHLQQVGAVDLLKETAHQALGVGVGVEVPLPLQLQLGVEEEEEEEEGPPPTQQTRRLWPD